MAIEKASLPIVHITALPTISRMVGIHRVLRGSSVTNVLGDTALAREHEKKLQQKYVLRALEILRMDIKEKQIFTLEGMC
jgi:glycine/betaine/sarcosine/D-proline reductase family selenoprotein B